MNSSLVLFKLIISLAFATYSEYVVTGWIVLPVRPGFTRQTPKSY